MVKKREYEMEATCSIWGSAVRATVENQMTSQESEFTANPKCQSNSSAGDDSLTVQVAASVVLSDALNPRARMPVDG